jgi:hypothetical protein
MPRFARLPAALIALALLCACDNKVAELFQPLTDGTSLPVSLETTTQPITTPLPHFKVGGIPGGATIEWDDLSQGCLTASATALQSGNIVEVRLHRSGDPSANCAPGTVIVYRYAMQVDIPVPGQYEVRLVDEKLGQAPKPIGRATVTVGPAI